MLHRLVPLAAALLLSASVLTGLSAPAGAAAPTVGALRVNGTTTPIVSASNPTIAFSWQVTGTTRGAAQTSWKLVVATTAAGAAAGTGDVATVQSTSANAGDTTAVLPPATALTSFTTYYWAVQSVTSDGASPWTTSRFATGAQGGLTGADWGSSSWIQVSGYARRTITLSAAPSSATLTVLARGQIEYGQTTDWYRTPYATGLYALSVNGTRFGSGSSNAAPVPGDVVLEPGQLDTDKHLLARSYDLTGTLTSGTNVVGFSSALPTDVRAILRVTYAGGSTQTLVTDGSWRGHPGPYVLAHRYDGVTVDASRAVPGWDTTAVDDGTWDPVQAPGIRTDYALGAAVTASAGYITFAGWNPAYLTDGVATSTDASEGFHSAIVSGASNGGCSLASPSWVQVDLGAVREVGQVRLAPATPTNFSPSTPGFAFPMRYRVLVGSDAAMSDARVLVDLTGADQPAATTPVVQVGAHPVPGRFVRIEVTRLRALPNSTSCAFALAELGVSSVNPGGAVDAPIPSVSAGTGPGELPALNQYGWSPRGLVDNAGSRDGDEGYASATTSDANASSSVSIDYGTAAPVGSVTLTPAQPTNYHGGGTVAAGHGFPVRYLVQGSAQPCSTATTWQTITDRTGADQPNPGSAPVAFPLGTPMTVQCLKLTATKLFHASDGYYLLALAEMSATAPSARENVPVYSADHPPVQVIHEYQPMTTPTLTGQTLVADFGTNRAGVVRLRLPAAAAFTGTRLVIKAGEKLTSGRVDTSNLTSPTGPPLTVNQQDTYLPVVTSGSAAAFDWAPEYVFRGFRYAQVSAADANGNQVALPAGLAMSQLEEHNAVASDGSVQFGNSGDFLNTLSAAVRQTQVNNLHGVPEDCPTREKRGWFGDAWVTQPEALDNFDMQSFYDNFDRQIIDNNNLAYSPSDWVQGPNPTWGSAANVFVPWQLYLRTGDRAALASAYASMQNTLSFLAARGSSSPTAPGGSGYVLYNGGGLGDHLNVTGNNLAGAPLLQTAIYYRATQIVSAAAAVLGQAVPSSASPTQSAAIRDAFNGAFETKAADGSVTYGTRTQGENAIAYAWGLVPGADRAALGTTIVNSFIANGMQAGIIGTPALAESLWTLGRNDLLHAYLENPSTTSNVYAKMLADGSGTIWESAYGPGEGAAGYQSHDHPAFASIGQWLYEGAAGIRPDFNVGYRSTTIAPSVLDKSVQGSVSTAFGQVSVTSTPDSTGSGGILQVSIPIGVTATVQVPAYGLASPTVTESGTRIFGSGAGTAPTGISSVGALTTLGTQTYVPVTVGSGTYTFVVG